MEKLFKNTFYIILILVTLNGCQSVKDGLTGQKKNNTDEFLIQKKNPLIQPPEFNELPEPYNSRYHPVGNTSSQLYLYTFHLQIQRLHHHHYLLCFL